ncbi:MAG: PEP-CTERM sorting domain-containing protein [Terriglobales bacterium]
MKNGFFAARISTIIVVFAFAVPAFADSIGSFNGAQITNRYFATQKFNLSYAGGYGNAWKGTPSAGYVRAAKGSGPGMTAPEPASLGLLGTGLVFIAGMFRHKLLGNE